MRRYGSDSVHTVKIVVTAVAAVALIARIVFPTLSIDAASLGLIALAILPWLAPLIKSAELPGGIKIEFQDFPGLSDATNLSLPLSAARAYYHPTFSPRLRMR